MQKILILADQNKIPGRHVIPNGQIVITFQSQFPNVLRIMPVAPKKIGKCWRQLMVNQKFHAVCRTT